MEILLPLLFSGILIALRQKVDFKNYPNATVYESFNVESLPKMRLQKFQLGYVPGNSTVVRQVAERVRNSLYLSAGGWATDKEVHIPQSMVTSWTNTTALATFFFCLGVEQGTLVPRETAVRKAEQTTPWSRISSALKREKQQGTHTVVIHRNSPASMQIRLFGFI